MNIYKISFIANTILNFLMIILMSLSIYHIHNRVVHGEPIDFIGLSFILKNQILILLPLSLMSLLVVTWINLVKRLKISKFYIIYFINLIPFLMLYYVITFISEALLTPYMEIIFK
jgi:hypothetical protein